MSTVVTVYGIDLTFFETELFLYLRADLQTVPRSPLSVVVGGGGGGGGDG